MVPAIAVSIPVLAGNVVTVPCPGAIADSAPAITSALLSIGPGGTVRLDECTYYLSGPVLVTGGFDGALKGAGIGRTVLTTLADLDGIEDVLMLNWISDVDNPGTPGPTLAPTLFHFSLFADAPNRVAMSDLTIDITDEHPAFASARAAWFGDALLAIITVEGVTVSTDFDRIELEGVLSDQLVCGTNVLYAIEVWGELSYWPAYGTDRPMVGGHALRRSVIEDVQVGYNFAEMANSRLKVHDNRFVDLFYDAVDGGDLFDSSLHVTRNDIELYGAWFGLALVNTQGAVVNQNRISGEPGSFIAGIYALSGTRYLILNNDVDDLVPSPGSYQVWLGSETSDSLVVGVDPALVLDEGTDNRIKP